MTASPETPVAPVSPSDALGDEPLFRLQIRVARRADELARQTARSRDADMVSWSQAEQEVLAAEPVTGLAAVAPAA